MTQHVPPRHLHPRHLGRAQPKLEFRWEPFHEIARELMPLFKRHWLEVGIDHDLVPLDIDWDSYFDLAARGRLHVLTAREASNVDKLSAHPQPAGRLNGYVFNLVGGHLHHASTMFAHTEMYWLDPVSRRGWEPVKMMLENIRGLKERGAVISTIGCRLKYKDARVGKLLARIGYEPTDIMLRKVL